MFALLGVTTLVLAAGAPWVLPAAAGRTKLKPPQNVEVDILDDTFTLRWDRSGDPAGNVTVSADYQTAEMMHNWTRVPGCQHVARATCSFSSLNVNVYEEMKLRVRAEEGDRTSPWRELDPFIPFQQARIGPPEVRLEAEDKAIAVNMAPPGARDSVMWHLDVLNFAYIVVVWSNASGAQTRNETLRSRYPRIRIHGLLPETTYCVKVKARLLMRHHPAEFSPAHCVSTTVENELPAPENIQVIQEDQAYVLTWDYSQDNVTFQAQWLNSYLKRFPGSDSEKWAPVQGCERARVPWCALPPGAARSGVYLRVRAARGSRASAWSQEEKFQAARQAALPPPVMALKPLDSRALRVAIGFQDQSEAQHYLLAYEVSLWENASDAVRTFVEQRAGFTLPDLKPQTVYCAAARALLRDGPATQRSGPSNTTCARTEAGGAPGAWLAAGVGAALAALLVLCMAAALGKLVRYVFFPAGRPPPTMEEYFPKEPLTHLLLSASAEQTEKCFIIEGVDAVPADVTRVDEDHKTYTSQTSQDSGNYSIEDGSTESSGGEEPGPPGAGTGGRPA